MKFWLGAAAAMGIALLLGGCDTVSKEQCQAGDWRALGRADAGRRPTVTVELRRNGRPVDITPLVS